MSSRKTVGILQIIIILALGITAITYVLEAGNAPKGDGKITVIASPDQTQEETPKWANDSTFAIADLGENLALGKTVTANGYNDVYEGKNAADGIPQTYWEGEPAAYPNIITVDLGSAVNVSKIRVRLNPEVIWSKRVQNFSVLSSMDGKAFKELVAAKDYKFDPKTGNMAVVAFDQAPAARFIQLQVNKNTGASAAQISEFEIY